MKENIALTVALAFFVTVLTLFGIGRLGMLDALTGGPQSVPLKIAVVDLNELSTEAARQSTNFGTGESALTRYEAVIQRVSDGLKADGYLVVPRTVILGMPDNNAAVEDVTRVYINALKTAP